MLECIKVKETFWAGLEWSHDFYYCSLGKCSPSSKKGTLGKQPIHFYLLYLVQALIGSEVGDKQTLWFKLNKFYSYHYSNLWSLVLNTHLQVSITTCSGVGIICLCWIRGLHSSIKCEGLDMLCNILVLQKTKAKNFSAQISRSQMTVLLGRLLICSQSETVPSFSPDRNWWTKWCRQAENPHGTGIIQDEANTETHPCAAPWEPTCSQLVLRLTACSPSEVTRPTVCFH